MCIATYNLRNLIPEIENHPMSLYYKEVKGRHLQCRRDDGKDVFCLIAAISTHLWNMEGFNWDAIREQMSNSKTNYHFREKSCLLRDHSVFLLDLHQDDVGRHGDTDDVPGLHLLPQLSGEDGPGDGAAPSNSSRFSRHEELYSTSSETLR